MGVFYKINENFEDISTKLTLILHVFSIFVDTPGRLPTKGEMPNIRGQRLSDFEPLSRFVYFRSE
jgi:hypothetical protein